jgi:AAA domain
VVLPPSVVGGKPYKSGNMHDFADLPASLAAALATAHGQRLRPKGLTGTEPDHPGAVQRATSRLHDLVEQGDVAVQGRGGDKRTYDLACELIGLGCNADTAHDLMLEIWYPHCEPNDKPELIERKIANAQAYMQNQQGHLVGSTLGSDTALKEAVQMLSATLTVEQTEKPRQSRFRPMRRAEYANLPLPQWMIKGIMPHTGIGLLIGHSGSFKTFVALGLAVAVATKRNTFGDAAYPVRQDGTTIVAAGEGGYALLTQRVPAVEKDIGASFTLDDYPFFVLTALPQAVSDEEVAEFIAESKAATAGAPPVRLIILDTLNVMGGGLKENVAEDMGQLMRVAGRIRDAFGCFVLVLHHPPKDATGEDIDARGSGALRAGADCVYIAVRQRAEGKYLTKLIVRKMKDGEEDQAIYLEGKRVDLGVNGDGDRVTSLVFQSIPKATYEGYAERTDDLPRRIGRALKELKAYHPAEVTSTVLADALVGQGEQPASSEARDKAVRSLTSRLSEAARDDQRVRAYARRDGEHKTAPWMWSLPASSRPDEAP